VSLESNWLKTAFRFRGSVIPAIYRRTIVCGLFGLMVSLLDYYKFPVSQKVLGGVIPSIVLGLLLVFRTNTAYERFWEGRKIWGTIVNTSRNLARSIWVNVGTKTAEELAEKKSALRAIVGFAVAIKQHLRGSRDLSELETIVAPEHLASVNASINQPLEMAFILSRYVHKQYRDDRLHIQQSERMNHNIDELVAALGACERILKTPIPLAYAIHLKQLLLIYCLLLPFQLVAELHWYTGLFVALIAFTLFGIEAIGIEIENPFGEDPNDLPLDGICQGIGSHIQSIVDRDVH
jgi:ion channel-forming bestrophin family protein